MHAETATATAAVNSMISLDDADQNIIAQWLAQRPTTTLRSYRLALRYLQSAAPGIDLRHVQLPHLQAFVQSLRGMKPSSQATSISVIQSLFSFAYKIGYLPTNPAVLLKRPGHPNNIWSGLSMRLISGVSWR